jgi:hypothetical protein
MLPGRHPSYELTGWVAHFHPSGYSIGLSGALNESLSLLTLSSSSSSSSPLPPIDFAVSDKEIVAKVHKVESEISDEKHESGNHETILDVKNVLVSTEQAYIDYFLYTFSELWNNGTNAEARIAYLEQGLEPEFTDVLNDGKKTSHTSGTCKIN